MTKEELLHKLFLAHVESEHDPEAAHILADNALIEYINDAEIAAAFKKIRKWYY